MEQSGLEKPNHYYKSHIFQRAPVSQCLHGGKASPAVSHICFSSSVGWHVVLSACPTKVYVPVAGAA